MDAEDAGTECAGGCDIILRFTPPEGGGENGENGEDEGDDAAAAATAGTAPGAADVNGT